MKTKLEMRHRPLRLWLCSLLACASLAALTLHAVPRPESKSSAATVRAKKFDSAQQAADALISAAQSYDVPALTEILGSESMDLLTSQDPVQDKKIGMEFGAKAKEKNTLVPDAGNPKVVVLTVGTDDWPMPIPLLRSGMKWSFDTKSGREEILARRIGRNELDALEICHGYVEAQHEYAMEKHEGSRVNQYAQRIISTPFTHDGLAWQNIDGTWSGPIGEQIARAIQQGYSNRSQPYHGYFFKILKSQGPAAPLGEMDFVVKGAMIGGFALVAVPAQYKVTGVMTFMVGYDGLVYQKDNGTNSLDLFTRMERYNPDKSWTPVEDQ
jgi:hypothetical protein